MYLGWTMGFIVIIFIFLLVAQAPKMTNLFGNTTLVLTCWTSEPFSMLTVITFTTCVLSCVLRIMSSIFLWLSCITMLVGFCLTLKVFLFLVDLLGGIYVCWCHRLLTWTACGSLVTCFICFAGACKLSIFLASCLTVLAGNLLNSTCPSFKVLDTNDSSFKKNQKMSLCKMWAVSCG